MTMTLISAAFDEGQLIPRTFAQEGDNCSPALEWSDPPNETKSYVLCVEDPDAPVATFTHWIVYDLPAGITGLDEGGGGGGGVFAQGRNDMGHAHYDGPAPPKGDGPHRYLFRLSAMNVPSLDVAADADPATILNAARQHVLAEATLTGRYERA